MSTSWPRASRCWASRPESRSQTSARHLRTSDTPTVPARDPEITTTCSPRVRAATAMQVSTSSTTSDLPFATSEALGGVGSADVAAVVRSTAFSRMQGRRHRQGPGPSGDVQILDAGPDPLHASDLQCAASGALPAPEPAGIPEPAAEARNRAQQGSRRRDRDAPDEGRAAVGRRGVRQRIAPQRRWLSACCAWNDATLFHAGRMPRKNQSGEDFHAAATRRRRQLHPG